AMRGARVLAGAWRMSLLSRNGPLVPEARGLVRTPIAVVGAQLRPADEELECLVVQRSGAALQTVGVRRSRSTEGSSLLRGTHNGVELDGGGRLDNRRHSTSSAEIEAVLADWRGDGDLHISGRGV